MNAYRVALEVKIMIYITGDVHGELEINKFSSKNFPAQKELTKNDYVIVCGDFGCVWSGHKDKFWLDWLENKNFTTLFCDGNHENFSLLNEYPVEEWNGGKVHKIRPSVIHLMRGQVFTIDDQKFFTFGGALSIDKQYRKEGISWWKEEIPSTAEFAEAIDNLEKHDLTVDVIITHTAPSLVIQKKDVHDKEIYDPTCEMLDSFMENVNFKQWFFGHFHEDKKLDKFTMIYDKITKLEPSTKVKSFDKEKAFTELDSIDFSRGTTICATTQCPRKADCYRYSIYQFLVENNIKGHTCAVYEWENCTKFINKNDVEQGSV